MTPYLRASVGAFNRVRGSPPWSKRNVPDDPQQTARRSRYQFTDEEIDRFLAAKWRMEECEVCHEPTIWGYFRPRPLSLIPASDGSTHAISAALVSALRLACNNCGNTKFLDSEFMRRWLDANPK